MSVRCAGRVVRLLSTSSAVRALLSEVHVQLNEVLCFIWRRSKYLRLFNVVVRMIGQGCTGKRSGRKLSSCNRDSVPGFDYSDSGKLQHAGCVSRGTFSECNFRAMYSIYYTNQYSIRINIKDVAPTCFGTSVPSSGSTICQVSNQLPVISYYLQGWALCSTLRCCCW
jgi:hypothetical protein